MNLQKITKKKLVSKIQNHTKWLETERHELYQKYITAIDADVELVYHNRITELDKIIDAWEINFDEDWG